LVAVKRPVTSRIASLPGFTPSYDSNGNVLNDSLDQYTWGTEGRPVTTTPFGGSTVSLTSDALGRTVEYGSGSTYTQVVYDPTGSKLALMNGQTLLKARVPLPGGGTATYTGSGLTFYSHVDWLGSSRFASTTSQTMYSSTAYAPYGEPYAQAGTTDISFTGQNADSGTGDYDFLFREYSIQGRWPSPDPAGLAAVNPVDPQSWNRYAYVVNAPTELTDPLGLCDYWNWEADNADPCGRWDFLLGFDCCVFPGGGGGGGDGGGGGGGGGHSGGSVGGNSNLPPIISTNGRLNYPWPWYFCDPNSWSLCWCDPGVDPNCTLSTASIGTLTWWGIQTSAPPEIKLQPRSPQTGANEPCTPLAHDPNAHGVDTVVDAFGRASHPLEMLVVSGGFIVAGAGTALTGSAVIVGGCFVPEPAEPLTCTASMVGGTTAITGGGYLVTRGVSFFWNNAVPAVEDWGCHE
jgi:RHS repeat-associated protein